MLAARDSSNVLHSRCEEMRQNRGDNRYIIPGGNYAFIFPLFLIPQSKK